MTKSEAVKERINDIREDDAEKYEGRESLGDNLTQLERNIINFLLMKDCPVSVREIAVEMVGEGYTSECKGGVSMRTVRNALRIPKDMDLIISEERGYYEASERMKRGGFKAAEEMAKKRREEKKIKWKNSYHKTMGTNGG